MPQCTKCGFENTAGANFCQQCGNRLAQSCVSCGKALELSARFCDACGERVSDLPQTPFLVPVQYTPPHLAERIRAEQAALERLADSAGERKTITVLFADMAGSTALIYDRDPEEAHHLITPVIELMMEAVHYYEGYVAKSLGDGILALFGAPIAHEDHIQRALYAALRMQEAMRTHSDHLRLEQGIPLQIRVGVHSGEVVVRSIRKDDLHADYDPVGHTIHIAARMEAMAAPSTILVSEPTYKLAKGFFEFKALGAAQVKGIPKPLVVYELLGLGPLRTRLQLAAHRGLARFVGREDELATLHRALQRSTAGHGQVVAVVGEAGVGKSRLFHEFNVRLQPGCLVLQAFSASHGRAFAYLPLIDLLKNYFQITTQDDEQQYQEKIIGKVFTLDRRLGDILPYLFHLLGIAQPKSALVDMGSSLRRERMFAAIVRLLGRESSNRPLEILFEDLQWLDDGTRAFLDYLIERLDDTRILLLVNYRSEYQAHWGKQNNCTEFRLDPLVPAEAQDLLRILLGSEPGLEPLKQLVLQKTEGNPFFMEEVVQTMAEEKVLLGQPGSYRIEETPTTLHIPTTVQGVLTARIDRLPIAQKELLQTLAVIGKEFSLSLIRQVAGQPDDHLYPLLAGLQAAEFIHGRPDFPEVKYAFKHTLTQEVVGNSLLSEQRRALHERTGRAIETLFCHQLKDHCNALAHHYSLSGNILKAVEYLHCAARQALERSAHSDAIRHLNSALEMLERLPDEQERAHQELALRLTLGPALIAARGQASTEVEENYSRALNLCEQGGITQQLFQVKLGLRIFYSLRADHETAYELGKEVLSLAENANQSVLLAQAHIALGAAAFYLGNFHKSRAHLEKGLVHYAPKQHPTHAALYGQDPGVRGQSFLARVLWYMGFPNQASEKCQEALALARSLSYPYSLAHGLVFAAELSQYRNDAQLTREYAEAAIALATEQGFPFWRAWATVLLGWALAELKGSAQGVVLIHEGLAAYKATGAELGGPYFLALLAQTYMKTGQVHAGLDALAQALRMAARTHERYYEAELHRLKGELLIQSSRTEQHISTAHAAAGACFHQAVIISHQQGATSLEVRAALNLARLWQEVGKMEISRQTLAALHAASMEGVDSPGWPKAKALLDALLAADNAS